MSALTNVIPAVFKAEYSPGNAFAAFAADVQSAGQQAERALKGSFDRINDLARNALSRPLNSAGGLDIGVGPARAAAAAAEQHAAALRLVAEAAAQVAARETELSGAQQVIIAQSRAAYDAAQRDALSKRELVGALEQLQAQLNQTGAATANFVNSTGEVGRSSGSARIAQMELMHVVRSSADAFAAGQHASTIFAMEIGRVAEAASFAGGSLGRFGAIMAGPWGLAITAGVSLLAIFVPKLFETGDAHDEAARRAHEHESAEQTLTRAIAGQQDATDKLAQSIRALNEQSRAAIETEYGRARATEEAAQREYVATQLRINNVQRQLTAELSLARASAAGAPSQATAMLMLAGGNSSGVVARQLAEQSSQRATALVAELRQLADMSTQSAETMRNQHIRDLQRDVEAGLDGVAAATLRYEQALERLNNTQGLSDAAYRRQYRAIVQQRDAAIQAARDAQQAARRGPDGDLTQFQLPVHGARTGRFGEARPGHAHAGIDIAVPVGTNVDAAAAGTVIEVGNLPGYGNTVIIDHGRGTSTRYAHLSRILAQRGQRVDQGDVIGLSGGARGAPGSGDSTGPHVHYEVRRNGRPTNPLTGSYPTDDVTAGARAATQATQQLNEALAAIQQRFDPAASAAAAYADALERIAALESAGRITSEQADQYREAARNAQLAAGDEITRREMEENIRQFSPAFQAAFQGASQQAGDVFANAGRSAGEAFRTAGIDAAYDIVDAFGGRMRGAVGGIMEILNGDGGRIGGRLGGILGLLEGPQVARTIALPGGGEIPSAIAAFGNPISTAMRQAIDPLVNALRDTSLKIQNFFRQNGDLANFLGQTLGFATLGGLGAHAVGGNATLGALGGALGGTAGKALGGALKSLFGTGAAALGGPIGSILGGIAGGLVTKLFSSTPHASTTIVGADGQLRISGTTGTKSLQGKTSTAGDSVIDTVQRIADLFGGSVIAGNGSVSIGIRKGNYRVDPTGAGRTKAKNGVLDFGDDAQAAVRAAVLDLIRDGVISGLRAGTQRLLQTAKDLDTGIDKAQKFEGVFKDLKARLDPVGAALDEVNQKFTGLRQIFKEAGASTAELAQLEQEYQLERADAIKQASEQMTSALKGLLDDLTINNTSLSLRERLADARAKYDPLAARVAAGDTSVSYDDFADAARTVEDLTRQIFGSTSPYFDVLGQITQLTQTALDRQNALIDAATGGPDTSLNGDGNQPVVGAIAGLGDYLVDQLGGELRAINDNSAAMVRLLAGAAGGGSAPLRNSALGLAANF